MQINKKGLFTSPFLLESFIILLNEYNGGFSMLDNLAVKIQKAFNLKSATGAKFLIIPLFTEIPVLFSWLILSDDIETPYTMFVSLWILICLVCVFCSTYYEEKG